MAECWIYGGHIYSPRSKYTIKPGGHDPISFGDVGGASPLVLSVFNDLYIVGVYTRITRILEFIGLFRFEGISHR